MGVCNSCDEDSGTPGEARLSRLVFVWECCLLKNQDNWMVSERGLGSGAVNVRRAPAAGSKLGDQGQDPMRTATL